MDAGPLDAGPLDAGPDAGPTAPCRVVGTIRAHSLAGMTVLPDGRVLFVGSAPDLATAGNVDVYDPQRETVTAFASLSVARMGASVLALPDGRVVVAGGDTTSVEVYEPGTGGFRTIPDVLPSEPWGPFLGAVTIGVVLISGGWVEGGRTLSAESTTLDLKNSKVSRIANAPCELSDRSPYGSRIDGRLAIGGFGGRGGDCGALFDPSTLKWSGTGTHVHSVASGYQPTSPSDTPDPVTTGDFEGKALNRFKTREGAYALIATDGKRLFVWREKAWRLLYPLAIDAWDGITVSSSQVVIPSDQGPVLVCTIPEM